MRRRLPKLSNSPVAIISGMIVAWITGLENYKIALKGNKFKIIKEAIILYHSYEMVLHFDVLLFVIEFPLLVWCGAFKLKPMRAPSREVVTGIRHTSYVINWSRLSWNNDLAVGVRDFQSEKLPKFLCNRHWHFSSLMSIFWLNRRRAAGGRIISPYFLVGRELMDQSDPEFTDLPIRYWRSLINPISLDWFQTQMKFPPDFKMGYASFLGNLLGGIFQGRVILT